MNRGKTGRVLLRLWEHSIHVFGHLLPQVLFNSGLLRPAELNTTVLHNATDRIWRPKQKGGYQIDLVHICQDFDRYKVLYSRMLCNFRRSGFDIQDPFGTPPAIIVFSRLRVPAPNDQNSFLSGTRLARVASPRAESRASRLLCGAFQSPFPELSVTEKTSWLLTVHHVSRGH
jgi:hypothetical protein